MNEQTRHETLRVGLGDRSYDIVAGEGILDRAGDLIAPLLPQPRAIVVTDDIVGPLYLDRLSAALERSGIASDAVTLPSGEATKDFSHLEKLIDDLLAARIERGTTVIALGGGVIGDITGFAASIVLRGIPFVQIPTTLLSQVDSSVGGKTGVNTARGKNLVGTFYQPRMVLADMATLDTLPRRQVLAGYAEVAKYGLISDPAFFAWLEKNGAAVCNGNREAQSHAVLTSCATKATIVAEDERENGRRALLNLGHTFGHALEAQTGFGDTLLHGEAVAIGMVMAFNLSVRLGLCPEEDAQRAKAHLEAIGLPVGLDRLDTAGWTADALYGHMTLDKKVADGRITFVLTKGVGKSFMTQDAPRDTVLAVLGEALKQA
ncbi:MAG: 3-dehydroquinate synthase [Rhodospirillales bacterium]|nr:3-dehydroquinate synthase [Rhodospirillales bacterium]MCW9040306.1 3-dehydroquinate synthase [Rhodospirillales bacterium]